MVWEPGEEAWETKLAALRSYRRATGHLAPRHDALWGEGEIEGLVPVGQHMGNLRRKGGLGKDAERADKRAKQLKAIDPDWDCPWPLDWQCRYRHLADLAEDEPGGVLRAIAPGVLMDGDDIGRWLERQKNPGTWLRLRTLRPTLSRPAELSADGADRARSLRRLSTPKSLCFRLLERDAAVSGVRVWPCYRVG